MHAFWRKPDSACAPSPDMDAALALYRAGPAGRTDLESVEALKDNPLLDQLIDGWCNGEAPI